MILKQMADFMEGDFTTMDFDKDKLKSLLNRYGKDNANHDKGAIAVPFFELVNCKKQYTRSHAGVYKDPLGKIILHTILLTSIQI